MNRFYIVIILGCLVYFSNLGGTSIYILDEAKNAGCAMEMTARGDWVIPTFNGKLRTDKPPLHYWFMAASYAVAGITPFAARFFSAVAGLIMIVIVYKNVNRLLNRNAAFYTALVVLSSIQVTIQFHLAVPDPYLILFITLGLFSFFNGFHHDPKQLYWMYIACALGFLTKGLIAVILPALIIFLYLAVTRTLNWTSIKKLNIPLGFIIFSVIALPWYIAVGYYTEGEWLKGFFLEHNLNRYTSTMEGHRGFPFSPFVILIAALLPFSVFIIHVIRLSIKDRLEHPILLFCLITGFVFATFFSFSKTILPSYPAPAIPFLAICFGYFLSRVETNGGFVGKQWIPFLLNLTVTLALSVSAYLALSMERTMSEIVYVTCIFLVLPLGSVAGWHFFSKKRIASFIYTWSGSWMLLGVLFFYVANPAIDTKNPVAASMPVITRGFPDHEIVAYHGFNPAYVFALQQTIDVVDSADELKILIANEKKVLVITRKKFLEEIESLKNLKVVYSGRDLFEKNETVLLAN